MTLPCDLCSALGSDGLLENSSQEEMMAHAEIHRHQIKYTSANDDFSDRDRFIKRENDRNLEERLEKIGSPSAVIQKRKNPHMALITAFCNKLFSSIKRVNHMKLECAKCGQRVNLVRDNSINSISIRRHAIIHLQKSMYLCNYCDYKSITRESMMAHLQQEHCISGMVHCKDLTGNHGKEIRMMIKDCFGQKTISSTNSLHDYVGILYRAKWRNQARISCNECGQQLLVRKSSKLGGGSDFHAKPLINHACVHLGKYLFSCRHCTNRTVSSKAMEAHLQKVHFLGGLKQNFVSTMDANREDIIEMIERCFGLEDPAKESVQAENVRNQKDIMIEHSLRSRAGENKLLADRQIHSLRLITKFSKSGMITCRICSHEVNIMQPNGLSSQKAIWHASTHVLRPLYKCRRCQKDIHVMSSVYRHMKKEHGITKGVTKEYDDFSNDLHLDLIDALTRSFDWSGSNESRDDEEGSDGSEQF